MTKVWSNIINVIQKDADASADDLFKQWISNLGPLDDALASGDQKLIAESLKESVSIIKLVIPHLKSPKLKQFGIERLEQLQELVQKFESGTGSIRDVDSFLTGTHKPLSNLLTELFKIVFDVAGNVVDLAGNVIDTTVNTAGNIAGDITSTVGGLVNGLLG